MDQIFGAAAGEAAQSFTPYWNFPIINDDDDDEYTIKYREYLENSSNAITPDLSTEEPDNSLSMGDEHLDTFTGQRIGRYDTSIVYSLKIDSLLEDFTGEPAPINPIPPGIHEDIDYVEASPPDSELVSIEEVEDDILRAKLSNIYLLIAKIESLNDNPTPFLSLILIILYSNSRLLAIKRKRRGKLSRVVMETIDEIDAFLDIDVSTDLDAVIMTRREKYSILRVAYKNYTIPLYLPVGFFDHEQKCLKDEPNNLITEDEEEKILGEGSLFPTSYGLGNLVIGSSSKNESVGLPIGTGIHHQEKSLYHQKELGCYQ
ncbi:hypothetical protein Tco_0289395 [Tanacetum coccineum]